MNFHFEVNLKQSILINQFLNFNLIKLEILIKLVILKNLMGYYLKVNLSMNYQFLLVHFK
jgi:hypothetical protein